MGLGVGRGVGAFVVGALVGFAVGFGFVGFAVTGDLVGRPVVGDGEGLGECGALVGLSVVIVVFYFVDLPARSQHRSLSRFTSVAESWI